MTRIILATIVCLLSALSLHPCAATPAAPTPARDVTVLFAVFEGESINLYSSHLDGSNRKLLLSRETKLTNARPADVIIARVSPDSRRIAYKVPEFGSINGPRPLFVMDAGGENKKQVVDNVVDFQWGTDSNSITYALPLPPPNPMDELSFHEDGFEWHRLNLQSGKDERVGVRSQKLHKFGAWLGRDRAAFISYRLSSPLLYILDFASHLTTPFELPIGLGNPELNASSLGGRMVVSGVDTSHACVFYRVDLKTKTIGRLFSGRNRCEGMAWNGNDEFFFGVWLNLPEGKTSEAGYIARGSIYRYDFRRHTMKAVLVSNGKQFYRFEGLVPGRTLIVSTEGNGQLPHYLLESRDLQGTHPVTLFASDKEMLFLGYLP